MPNSPYVDSTGDIASQAIKVRGQVHDGAGAYDYTIDGQVAAGANFDNDDDPIDMRGQIGVNIIFEASLNATITLYGAEVNPAGGYFYYKLYDTQGSVAGALITKNIVGPDTWMASFPVTAPYVVVRGTNTGAANNNIYVRIF